MKKYSMIYIMRLLTFFFTCYLIASVHGSIVNEDADFENDKYNLLHDELVRISEDNRINNVKRKNIPLVPSEIYNVREDDSVNNKHVHPVVRAFVSDRPHSIDKQGERKTVIPVSHNMVYDIHDGPNDQYEELDHDISRRFDLYPKWFSHRIPSMFGRRFAKRYFHPYGSLNNRAQIAHHRPNTDTASRRTFRRGSFQRGSWMHPPASWPQAPHEFGSNQKRITLNELPKEFMEMQPGGRITPMGQMGRPMDPMAPRRSPTVNMANAVGDLVDIPDGEGPSLDDDLKEIPHTLMKHLGPDEYAPFAGQPNDHWQDYSALPHGHHHRHDMNPCHHQPCLNNGECHFTHHSPAYNFKCNCNKGFSGHYCEHTPFSCHPNPCAHDGLCTKTTTGYFCTCPQDYKGHDCKVESACLHAPCSNNGQCTETAEGFYCECEKNFGGKTCNEKINPCSLNPCMNGGTCVEIEEGERFECTCPKGFGCVDCTCPMSTDGVTTLTATLPVAGVSNRHPTCPDNACKNGGSCITSSSGFSCNCPSGFHGLDCAVPDLCTPNPCENSGICVQDGSENYKCVCPYGFKGSDCQTPLSCSTHPCMNGGSCVETPDGFHCRCSSGFKGQRCTDLSPCSKNPCMHKALCMEKGALFTCQCKPGYRGKNCREKDPCKPNPCQNGDCVEVNGVTACNCTKGWMGDSCDIQNLCQQNKCLNGATCIHTLEEFKCVCPEGFHGINCELRSPCHTSPCENGGICEASGSTFMCRCAGGFHGDRCHLTSHCHPNPCHNGAHCFDGDLDFVCECPHGYFGHLCEERRYCYDDPCLNNAQCFEKDDGFRCECRLGNYGKVCENNICDEHPCGNGGTCMPSNNDIGYACECRFPFHGHRCDESDPCNPNPCHNDGTCHSHLQQIHDMSYHQGPTFHGSDENVVTVVGPIHNETVHHHPYYDENSHELNYLPDAQLSTNEVNHFHLTSDLPHKVYEEQLYHARNADNDDVHSHFLEPQHNHGYHIEEYPHARHRIQRVYKTEYNDEEKRSFKEHHHRHQDVINNKKSKRSKLNKGSVTLHRKPNATKRNNLNHASKVIINIRKNRTGELVKRTIRDLYVCQCTDGYLGAHCQHMNPCRGTPCNNGGTCIPRGDHYQCHCINGFGGLNCDDPHPCEPNPCLHNGKCVLEKSIHGYACDCSIGWRGYNCEVQDHCAIGNPCQHGGRCINMDEGVTCQCRARFIGDLCEIDKCADCDKNAFCRHGHCVCKPGYIGNGFICKVLGDVCQPNPCDNQGTCKEGRDGKIFTCECQPGFIGSRCEFSHPCVTIPCLHNGVCVDESNSKDRGILMVDRNDYKCFCTQGYRGKNCEETSLAACSSNPCYNNGTCFDSSSESHRHHLSHIDDYECFCAKGFAGKTCEVGHFACYSDPCMNGGICIDAENLPGANFDAHGYKCNCRKEFTGRNCEVTLNGPGPCQFRPCLHDGRCIDVTNNNDIDFHFDYDHEFKCLCQPQYSGKHCEVPYSACYSMPCLHNGTCIDKNKRPKETFDETGYHCQCMAGYEGKNCEHQFGFGSPEDEYNVIHPTDISESEGINPTPLVVFMKSSKKPTKSKPTKQSVIFVKEKITTPAPEIEKNNEEVKEKAKEIKESKLLELIDQASLLKEEHDKSEKKETKNFQHLPKVKIISDVPHHKNVHNIEIHQHSMDPAVSSILVEKKTSESNQDYFTPQLEKYLSMKRHRQVLPTSPIMIRKWSKDSDGKFKDSNFVLRSKLEQADKKEYESAETKTKIPEDSLDEQLAILTDEGSKKNIVDSTQHSVWKQVYDNMKRIYQSVHG